MFQPPKKIEPMSEDTICDIFFLLGRVKTQNFDKNRVTRKSKNEASQKKKFDFSCYTKIKTFIRIKISK